AMATRYDPAFAEWLTCGDTWFVGVNALANDEFGSIAGSGALPGEAIRFARTELGFGAGALDRGQVSICYPGFPKPRAGENEAGFAYRVDRDGAHVDGLHPVGPEKNRKQLEFQGFLLAYPITKAGEKAAPLVVWEGSQKIMQAMFRENLSGLPTDLWSDVDLTIPYHQARRQVFETCKRRIVHAEPGEAYLLHRMALHGVSGWQKGAGAQDEGRAVLYFRPEIPRTDWL
ncbi:MAG: hypothetical protein ACI932_001914, partial [Paracoccaceae bacterium]